ncbi:DUF1009 domain-containing protein, partial [Mesorhizobium sp. VK2D]|nr:DUF1009 domain-containing protein [Mesorhizobium sp. VK2D]
MTRAEPAGSALALAPGSRVGIIAGGGSLPVEVADGLAAHGHPPFILLMEGEADRKQQLSRYEHVTLALEQIGSLVSTLKRHGVTHLVLAGEIKRRPRLSNMRPSLGLLAIVPSVIVALARGDDGLLKILTRGLEKRGI